MKYIILLCFLTQSAFAYDVKYYEKGQTVEQSGFLFPPQAEKEIRLQLIDSDYHKKLNLSLEQINKTYEENTIIMQTRIKEQEKQLQGENSFFNKYSFFLLGCLTATAVAFAVGKVSK